MEIEARCAQIFLPLLKQLNQKLDVCLVKSLLDLVLLIVQYREHQGLILSELGGQLSGEAHAPAGVHSFCAKLKINGQSLIPFATKNSDCTYPFRRI